MNLKPSQNRPVITEPAQLVFFYVTKDESKRPTIMSEEKYKNLQSYDPSLNPHSYEEYCQYMTNFLKFYDESTYVAEKSAITKQNQEEVFTQIESRPDFKGWLVSKTSNAA